MSNKFLNFSFHDDWFKMISSIVSLFLFISLSFPTAFFWSVFLIWWSFRLDSRFPTIVALLFLIIVPGLLAFEKNGFAENFAVYAFFLISITVALQLIELIRDNERDEPEETVPPIMRGNILDLRKHHGSRRQ